MPERFSFASWFRRHRARVAVLAVSAVAVMAAACTESFDGGASCPSLCPSKAVAFKDTTFDAVELDTSLVGYPTLGISTTMLLANRPDTLVTRTVLRFDALPGTFNPNAGADVATITAIDSVYLKLPLDTLGRRGSGLMTLDVFDVDTLVSDSVASVVKSLFRQNRKIGSIDIIPSATRDTLRVSISKTVVLAKLRAGSRLRLGLQLRGASGQIRLRAFASGVGVPTLSFDPSTDTIYAAQVVNTNTNLPLATADQALSYQMYTLVDKGSLPPDATTLIVGGFPAYRSYLRFNVPKSISDSASIVRAEVLLTQRRSTFANASDTVTIEPLVPTTTNVVSDLRRLLDLAAPGSFASLDTSRLVPSDSGLRVINVLSLARSWPSLPTTVPRGIAFRIGLEGGQPAELRFFSSKAAVGVRPRLRITYQPRIEFAIP